MPLGDYGFSRLFTWVNDRYGISWQLNFTSQSIAVFHHRLLSQQHRSHTGEPALRRPAVSD